MLANTTTFILITLGTMVALAGTDLVLPAVPSLPAALGGDLKTAQYVLAAFAAGTGVGLLLYGELGTRFNIGNLLVVSLLAYAAISLLATFAGGLVELSVARFLQGLVAAGPAVFAPVMIKAMYEDLAAVAALGRIGSIESMTPAFAPVLGAWLLTLGDWTLSFYLTAAIAFVLSLIWLASPKTRLQFGLAAPRVKAGYVSLLVSGDFMRHALSQAFTLGALLIMVFAAPTVITQALGGDLSDFIVMQVVGIFFFVVTANTSHYVVDRIGAPATVLVGTAITAFGCISILIMALTTELSIVALWVLFVFVNMGLGIRGPAGFFRALQAAGENESRGSALIVLLVMFTTALGTALVAPFVDQGLVEVALLASVVSGVGVLLSIERGEED